MTEHPSVKTGAEMAGNPASNIFPDENAQAA
jgi:hypothetical protein